MVHVSNTLEQFDSPRHQISRRIRVEEAPHGEGHRQIVNHRRATEHRRPSKSNGQTTAYSVVDVQFTDVQTLVETPGQSEPVPLIGTLMSKTLPDG